MLRLAFGLLCAATAIGGGLAVRYMRGPAARPLPAGIAALHAGLGAASLLALLLTLRRGLPQGGMGTEGFGPGAAALISLALALGLVLAHVAWRGRRPPAILVGTHASLAVAGLVLLLALLALR
ncbi:MAG TPA: hypothetical protein VKQ73_16750 [Stellaceae bacterium]|nr:hypothetical protein [Stellaceae bacterium]